MAVKQNNTDASASQPITANNSTSGALNVSTSSTGGLNGGAGGGVKANINANMEVDGDDGMIQPEVNNDQEQFCPQTNKKKIGSNQDAHEFSDGLSKEKVINNIGNILHLTELVEYNQQEMNISSECLLEIYEYLLDELSRIPFPRSPPDERQRFKDAMSKIGDFFGKSNDKKLYLYYLRFVWQLISEMENENETPSCALAVIFNLFEAGMIMDAVYMLLDYKISNEKISSTVRLLCKWLSICTFCQNIHLWIIAIFTVLQEQQKIALIEDIACENIVVAFSNMIVPILRPKVTPLCFCFLTTNTSNPVVFHKIVPRIPKVFRILKQQADSLPDVKPTMQKMAMLINALITHFSGYDDLYHEVVEVLKECQTFNGKVGGDALQHSLAQLKNNAKTGLLNLGNTCYMNSVLQALANTQEFTTGILLCKSSPPLIIRMQEQIALMLYSYRDLLTPERVLNVVRPQSFVAGLQQDSSEFLSYLLETLHEQETNFRINTAVESTSNSSTENVKIINKAQPNDDSRDHKNCGDEHEQRDYQKSKGAESVESTKNVSTIEKTFTGKQVTTYRCLKCGSKSLNVDTFRDLQLAFPELKNECASNYSVQDLLDFYCSPEKLDGDNKYFCERCQQLTDGERSVRVIRAPNNLIITLKHFKYDQKYHTRAKLMLKVFHDEKVYVKVCEEKTLEEIASAHYDLYASVVHSGYSMDSGHYYTYAADASNNWFKFNDSIVTPSKAEELHNLSQPNTPYILFYRMVARSNECPEAIGDHSAASTKNIQIEKVETPPPLKLDELPRSLQEYVNRHNDVYNEELKARRLKNKNSTN